MKREIDLARQLLFDIEAHGPDCSLTTLRNHFSKVHYGRVNAASHDGDDRVRYHLRLLIDAGMVKEVDHTNAGVPCVRLTNAGHEFLELARCDHRWADAKACCADTTGGLSLTVIRALLTKWAVEATSQVTAHSSLRAERYVAAPRRRNSYRPYYYHRIEPRRRHDVYRNDLPLEEEELRLVRSRPDYLERNSIRERVERPIVDANYVNRSFVDSAYADGYVSDAPYSTAAYANTAYANRSHANGSYTNGYATNGYSSNGYSSNGYSSNGYAAASSVNRRHYVRDTFDYHTVTEEPTIGVSLPISLV